VQQNVKLRIAGELFVESVVSPISAFCLSGAMPKQRKETSMRSLKPVIAAAALLLGVAWTAPAMAFGHFAHARVGVFIGPGFGYGYYPSPYYYGYGPYAPYPYYYGPTVGAPAQTEYVEQGSMRAAPQQQAQASWYYCADPQGYYPYVQQCRAGWQRVSPTPPGTQQ
jgi:hypothetical protein